MLPDVQKALLDLVLDQNKLFLQYPDPCFVVVCQIDLSVCIAVFVRPSGPSRLLHIQDRIQLIRNHPGYLQHPAELRFNFDSEFIPRA